jgi:peptidyl-prolyl cis-trans isomerase C
MLERGHILPLVALCPLLALACSSPAPITISESQTHLGNSITAKVGSQTISVHTVAAVSSAQHLSPVQARAALVRDALFAEDARERSLLQRADVQTQMRGVLASALIEAIKSDVAQAPLTPDEVSRFTQLHWLDLDRPLAIRTVHAVVRVPENADDALRKRASELASRIADAVRNTTTDQEFISAAKAVPTDGLEVVAESLSPVTADGRVCDLKNRPPPNMPPQEFDKDFAAAAHRLKTVGETSPPESSAFGWHVIRATEFQPENRVPEAKRAILLRDEILASRAKVKVDAIIDAQKTRLRPSIERNAENQLEILQQAKEP